MNGSRDIKEPQPTRRAGCQLQFTESGSYPRPSIGARHDGDFYPQKVAVPRGLTDKTTLSSLTLKTYVRVGSCSFRVCLRKSRNEFGHSHFHRLLQFLLHLLFLSSLQSCWRVKQHTADLIKTPPDQTTPLSLSRWKPKPSPGLRYPRQQPKQKRRSRQSHARLNQPLQLLQPLQPQSRSILLSKMGQQKLRQQWQVMRLQPPARTLWNT
ncbi:uncharacterized protein LOC130192628 [Pseudoliparis swirei]|uniref:uncharacterized protein LOC130192628 n=1 Tax=Pseudoliparis swirei TaxID=2059687 RepID=UPI0024BE1CA7|nr:uncharacterized protein LOC130192628 [Pseudoliparis swirei]